MSAVTTGIPTLYRGVRMRSRLEARWAAFFDRVGWPWEYEPVDLKYYIPDFVLRFPRPVLVEIKPETEFAPLATYADRFRSAGWTGEFVVLGATLFDVGGEPAVGVLGEVLADAPRGEHALAAAVVFQCIGCGTTSLRSQEGSWRCRATGCYEGNAHVGQVAPDQARCWWAEAGNRVQWMPEGGR